METINKINNGFKFLKKDCRTVSLIGFVNKNDIPKKSSREEYDDEEFNHEYSDINSDGYDEGNFWGNIYLPLNEELYMNFEVYA